MVSVNNKIAYAEIYELLELLGDDYKKKIPVNYCKYIIEQKPEQYDIEKIRRNVSNYELSEEALKIFSIIYIEYIVEDELAKKAYKEIIKSSKSKKQNIEVPKIDYKNIKSNLFEDRKNKEEQLNENKEIIQYKKINFFKKILNKLKKWLKHN